MDQCPVQGELKTLIRLTRQKLEISAGSMGSQVRKGFSYLANKRYTNIWFWIFVYVKTDVKLHYVTISVNKILVWCFIIVKILRLKPFYVEHIVKHGFFFRISRHFGIYRTEYRIETSGARDPRVIFQAIDIVRVQN